MARGSALRHSRWSRRRGGTDGRSAGPAGQAEGLGGHEPPAETWPPCGAGRRVRGLIQTGLFSASSQHRVQRSLSVGGGFPRRSSRLRNLRDCRASKTTHVCLLHPTTQGCFLCSYVWERCPMALPWPGAVLGPSDLSWSGHPTNVSKTCANIL